MPGATELNTFRDDLPTNVGQKQLLLVMNEINKKLLEGVSYQKVLDLVFDSLDRVIPYDRIGIALVEGSDDDAKLSMKWVRSKVAVTHLNLAYSSPVQGSSLQKILGTGTPRIIKDGIRSSLTCPLRSGNEQVGVVFFSSCRSNTYRAEHIETFRQVANELSMIVDHGRLSRDFDASKEQTRNLNMILHDLKSPLSTIQGFAQASFDEPWFQKLDADAKEVFQIFLRNSKYMFDLLNELTEISELDRNSDALELENVSLSEFCREMTNFGKVLAEAKEIQFLLELDVESSSLVRFDRHKIRRVLDNLFSNAIKFSKRGSTIRFSAACENDRVTFSVRDEGPGIPTSEMPKLFLEFGKTTVRPTEGETSTGLGLAIAKKIVQQHNGAITVESEIGKGSTFSFWIAEKISR